MKKVLVGVLAVLGGLALFAVLVGGGIALVALGAKPGVPRTTILELDLDQKIVETIPNDPVARILMQDRPTVRDIVEGLERASRDDRVKALIARVGTPTVGLAEVQEIRDAVAAFRKTGKPAVAYAETFGEFSPGNVGYYLATAFDRIYLNPSGDVNITGLMYESPFVRGMLDKLGVVPRLDHRKEYKNAMNTFTERRYTAPHREAMKALMDSQFSQIVRGVAEARHRSEEEVRQWFDQGPFLGTEAEEAGVVDGLKHRDQAYQEVRDEIGGTPHLLYLRRYLERAGRPHRRGEVVALIYGVGSVTRGESEYDPLSGGASMGSDTVAAAFRDAIRDDSVKAILFRVDSPGGSAVASEVIRRETERAREAGKPVIVSMGDVAGSGGYWVAMTADKIVAQPATITGSIGVLGGKMLTSGFWSKLGINWDEVHTSRRSDMWSGTHDYDPGEWDRVEAFLDRIYDSFTQQVAEGRHLPLKKVQEIAKGRIWSGEDGKRLGLVDELGGFPTAIRLVKEAAGIPAEREIQLRVFPRPKSPLQALLRKRPASSEGKVATALAARRILEQIRPLVRWARAAGYVPSATGPVSVPEMEPAR